MVLSTKLYITSNRVIVIVDFHRICLSVLCIFLFFTIFSISSFINISYRFFFSLFVRMELISDEKISECCPYQLPI